MSVDPRIVLTLTLLLFVQPVSADTYGTGTLTPLPNVTNISVYDVTDETTDQGNETGGELIDFGLNSTLKVSQQNERDYRFTFKVVNEGGGDWAIESGDDIIHQGLNDSWTVQDIWYNVSGDQDYDGGSFASGQVTWDTSSGSEGTVPADGGVMYAKYIVSVSDPDSANYSEYFEVNDSSSSSGSFDYHKFFVEKLGFLDLDILEPPNDSVVVQNQSFIMNSSITCKDGKCGTVTVKPRYNESSTADTDIPVSTTAEPFNTNVSSKSCELGRGESCYSYFHVNASGNLETYHLLDFNGTSSRDISSNDSEDNLVQINTARIINVTWDTLDFGELDPGSKNVSALGNDNRKYNVSVDSRSENVEGLWVRATDLNSSKLDYTIPAENISFSTTNDIDTEKSLLNTFQLAASNLSPGSILSTYYWIDVPLGIYNGGYSGKIYFKANGTG